MVELAFLTVPLVFILLGVIELGLLWRDALTLDQASRSGARVGANLTNDPQADREALRALVSNLDADQYDEIEYVVVYQVDSAGDMPVSCATTSSTVCNHYTSTMLDQLDNDVRWGCGGSAYDIEWCPTSRNPEFHTPVDLGVHVVTRRVWLTGWFADVTDLTSTTVMRLDPLTR